MSKRDEPGEIEAAVRRACTGRTGEPLAQVAVMLGRQLDGYVEAKALPGVARELRLTLTALGVATVVDELDVVDEIAERRAARRATATAD